MARERIFHLGDWLVDSETCTLKKESGSGPVSVEPRAMDVLIALCRRPGEVLSAEELLRLCWDGVVVGENQVYKAIAQLRKSLGDDAGSARYIESIRKRGYRTIASVTALPGGRASGFSESRWTGSPFVGLNPFGGKHAAVFFGRDEATARLLEVVTAQVYSGRALVLVFGPSGTGKTSLIQAGLLPALQRSHLGFEPAGAVTLDLGDIGTASLSAAIGSTLLDLEIDGAAVLSGHSAEAIGAALAGDSGELLVQLQAAAATARSNGRFIIVVDRLEALFNSPTIDPASRTAFLSCLDRLASSGAAIVIAACRNDFYPEVAKEPVLMQGKPAGAHFDVGPPLRAEIAQMIRGPAAVASLTFGIDPKTGAQLDDVLCEAAADNPDALPMLQYTLQELYLQRSHSRELTVAAYDNLGGLGGALGRRAETTLEALPEAARRAFDRVLSLVVTVNDDSVRSRRERWSTLSTAPERELVQTLVEQRLFVSFSHDGASVFGIAHEALLRQWPRVVAWISEHRQALRVRTRLEGSARRWLEEGRPADLLLPRGKLLEEARELLSAALIPLNVEVTALISASIRKAQLADRRRAAALAGFALIAIIAVVLGIRAHHAEAVADQHRREAEGLMEFMVGELADKLKPLGRLDMLADVSGKALSYFDAVQPAELSAAARDQQARALQTLAEVARSRGKPDEARRALFMAKNLLDTNLAQGHETAAILKDLGADSFWLGQLSLDEGQLDAAAGWFRQYADYSNRMMAREPDNVDAWIESSYAENSLGSVAQMRGEYPAAAAAFAHSIELKKRALTKRPDDHVLQAELADSVSWLGSAHQAQGELRQALELFEQEQGWYERLRITAPSELNWTFRLLGAHQRHANLLTDTGKDAEAAAETAAAIVLARDLSSHNPQNRIWERQLWVLETVHAETQANLGKLTQALELELTVVAGLNKLIQLDPANQGWRSSEAIGELLIGEILLRLGRAQEARDRITEALDRMASITLKAGSKTVLEQKKAQGWLSLADSLLALGQRPEAITACTTAIATLEPLLRKDVYDYHTQDLWVRTHLCIDQGDQVAGATRWLEQIGYRRAEYVRLLSHHH